MRRQSNAKPVQRTGAGLQELWGMVGKAASYPEMCVGETIDATKCASAGVRNAKQT